MTFETPSADSHSRPLVTYDDDEPGPEQHSYHYGIFDDFGLITTAF